MSDVLTRLPSRSAALRGRAAGPRFGVALIVLFVRGAGAATSCVPAGSALHLSRLLR